MGHSLTKLINFCSLSTTYLPLVDIGVRIPLLLRENMYTDSIPAYLPHLVNVVFEQLMDREQFSLQFHRQFCRQF